MGRLLPFILIILILLGAIVAVPILLRPDSHRAQIAATLSQKLHHTVAIGKVDVRFIPPVLRLHDVTVFKSADTPLLQTDEIDAVPDWSGLFHIKFLPSSVIFNHPVLWIRRLPEGSWDSDEWWSSVSQLAGSEGWPLHTVQLHGGECHWVDTTASQEIVLNNIEGMLNRDQQSATFSSGTTGLATPLTVTFEGKGHFGSSPQWAGDARFADEGRSWVVHLEDRGENLEAKGQAQEWRWDSFYSLLKFYCRWPGAMTTGGTPLIMQDWKTHFTVVPGSATFYHSASIGGGLTEVKGNVSPGSGALQAHVEGAFQDVPVSFFASGFDTLASIDGKLTGITRFELVFSTQPWSGFKGQGSVEIRDGRYMLPPGSLKSLARAHTMAYLKRKFPDFKDKGLTFNKLRVHWQAASGFITFDDALMDAGDVKAALVGRLDGLRHGIDSTIRLQIHESSTALRKEIPGHYLYGAPGHEQIQPIYGHLQGSWNEWSLRASASGKFPPGSSPSFEPRSPRRNGQRHPSRTSAGPARRLAGRQTHDLPG